MANTELLDCPVCLEIFSDPQLISACGHTFCKRCLQNIHPRRCPTCRAAFTLESLRPNYALLHLLQDNQSRNRSQSTSSHALPNIQANIVRTGAAGDTKKLECKLARLMDIGLPFGLAQLVSEEDQLIARRIFLLDNSGSTATTDGHVLEVDPYRGGMPTQVACSRWHEIQQMALQQADWNCHIGTPCEFLLLNPPSKRDPSALREGVDYAVVDAASGVPEHQVSALRKMLERTQPRGPTPLYDRLSEIYSRVSQESSELANSGQRIVLVIATDGLPTGAYSGTCTDADRRRLIQQLRKLTSDLPIFVVVRLTTDEEDVVEFYNSIDEELELPLEVLDDLESEAKEIAQQGNGWLTYSPLIHTLREGGTFVKLFDLLDERRLTRLEVVLFVRLLLQRRECMPLPADPALFCELLEERVAVEDLVYDPLRRRLAPLVDVRAVQRAVLPFCSKPGCCWLWSLLLGRSEPKREYAELAPEQATGTSQREAVQLGRPAGSV